MCQHDPRHVDALVKDLGLEHGNSRQTPAAHDVTDVEPMPLDQTQQLQITNCKKTVPQSRSNRHHVHREQNVSKNVQSHTAEPCNIEGFSQILENVKCNPSSCSFMKKV